VQTAENKAKQDTSIDGKLKYFTEYVSRKAIRPVIWSARTERKGWSFTQNLMLLHSYGWVKDRKRKPFARVCFRFRFMAIGQQNLPQINGDWVNSHQASKPKKTKTVQLLIFNRSAACRASGSNT